MVVDKIFYYVVGSDSQYTYIAHSRRIGFFVTFAPEEYTTYLIENKRP
jgi:hypothetical protein